MTQIFASSWLCGNLSREPKCSPFKHTHHTCTHRYIILGGSFDDFSGRWYEYVGVSFIIVLFIQCIFPLLNVLIEVTISVVKRILVLINKNATQVRRLRLCNSSLVKLRSPSLWSSAPWCSSTRMQLR